MAASSSRGQNSSPYQYQNQNQNQKPSSPFSSSSSSSSFKQTVPRSYSTSTTVYGASGNGYGSRSDTLGRTNSDSMYGGGYGGRSPVGYQSADEMIDEQIDEVARPAGGDSISVTIRFRPLR